MACGVPVVASNAGGIPEVVVDGETGFLAPVGDVATMTNRALEALRDPARLETLRRAAVARAAVFSADKIVPHYERLYEDVLRG
jgi:glycosyltransferase involved in cell wall biosynthesis